MEVDERYQSKKKGLGEGKLRSKRKFSIGQDKSVEKTPYWRTAEFAMEILNKDITCLAH